MISVIQNNNILRDLCVFVVQTVEILASWRLGVEEKLVVGRRSPVAGGRPAVENPTHLLRAMLYSLKHGLVLRNPFSVGVGSIGDSGCHCGCQEHKLSWLS